MENDIFKKKILMKTQSSTFINTNKRLVPQWISQNQLNYASSYEFSSYNAQLETIQMLQRNENESEILLTNFRQEINQSKCQIHYIYEQNEQYYLSTYPSTRKHKILLYKNNTKKVIKGFQSLLNSILMSQEAYYKSSKTLVTHTQKIIQDIQLQKQVNRQQDLMIADMKRMIIVEECQLVILHLQMKQKSAIMLANYSKIEKEKQQQYYCQFYFYNVQKDKFLSNQKRSQGKLNRVIHLFSEKIIQIQKLQDFSKLIVLTQKHLLLLKLDLESMTFIVLHKINLSNKRKGRVTKIGINRVQKLQFLVALSQYTKQTSMKLLKSQNSRSYIRFFKIQDDYITQLSKQKNMKVSFQDEQEFTQKTVSIKFIEEITQNEYEIEDQSQEDRNSSFNSITKNVIMSVFNNLANKSSISKKKKIQDKIKSRSKIHFHIPNKTFRAAPTLQPKNYNQFINSATNLVSNKNIIVLWAENQSCIHICKIISERQQKQRDTKALEQMSKTLTHKHLQKQNQYLTIYSQLMGNVVKQKQQKIVEYESIIQYQGKIQIALPFQSIFNIQISPNNNNFLIVSKRSDANEFSYSIFQYELFNQLESTDPNLFTKNLKYFHKNKSTNLIANSLVKETPIFLTGNTIHTFENQLMEGAFCFDIHPYHFYMTVSFGFSAKVYALQGNQTLTSIYTINGQGIKEIKYSATGNHICLLFSKIIKIIDAYSFNQMNSIHEKNSSFIKCGYSSNGLQFYTLSQNYVLSVYNTFNYSKIDQLKPNILTLDYKPIAIKSYLKHLQYCIILQNGGLFVKHKKDAVVIQQQIFCRYNDNQIINAIQIDQNNEILFVGCKSGKLRAHIWPFRQYQSFENYNQLRISFASIQSLSVSKISPYLFVGCTNGNISKINYLIEKDNNFRMQMDHTPLLNSTNIHYLSFNGPINIQKSYNYVLTSYNSLNEQVPEKLKLQFKLTEVITRLNEQMNRMKANIKQELDQKSNLATQKLDLSMYHHLNRIVMTKLLSQYKQQSQENKKEKELLIKTCDQQLRQYLEIQHELTKEKSLLVSDFYKEKNQLKESQCQQLQNLMKQHKKQYEKIQNQVIYSQKKMNQKQQPIYFLAGINNCIFDEQLKDLTVQLDRENKKHFELRKSCAYKQTAIKDICMKNIREETLEFKIKLQQTEMIKKYDYNKNIMQSLRQEINEAESKVDKVQRQSTIIKSNAQFKKIARLDQMNDACSYKLWLKEKKEIELSDLADYLRKVQEVIEQKSVELVNLIGNKNKKLENIKEFKQDQKNKKINIKKIKLNLLDSQNSVKKIGFFNDYRNLTTQNVKRHTHRIRPNNDSIDQKIDKQPKTRLLKKASTSRQLQKTKHINSLNNIIDKSLSFLKTSLNIHHRKIDKFGKENGELLNEYQKLKYEHKWCQQKQAQSKNAIIKITDQLGLQNHAAQRQQNTVFNLTKTSFQKYIRNRKNNNFATKYKTAVSTPLNTQQF